MLELVSPNSTEHQEITQTLDTLAREGARMLLMEALNAEVSEYIERHREQRDEAGRALVVRNGSGKSRKVTVGSGTLDIKAPRVNDRREGKSFSSSILPPYLRRSANVDSLLPVLYLKGLSGNAFSDALVHILGEGASGLSASSISALKRSWQKDFEQWKFQAISERFVYIWADGVNVKVRLCHAFSIVDQIEDFCVSFNPASFACI